MVGLLSWAAVALTALHPGHEPLPSRGEPLRAQRASCLLMHRHVDPEMAAAAEGAARSVADA